MPTVGEIEKAIFELAPRHLALDWDNVGLLVGRPERETRKVLVSLDITEEVIEEAKGWGAELIVSHHPVIFNGQKTVTSREEDIVGRRVLKLLEGGIAAICMHTNLDVAEDGVNDALASRLGLWDFYQLEETGVLRVGTLEAPMPLTKFAARVCGALGCNGLRYADAGRPVYRVGVGGGACGEFEDAAIAAGCDTFVTADLSYHQFVDAKPKGINLVDAGHFPTEDPVCEVLADYLRQCFPEVEVRKSKTHREVIQYYVRGE